MDTFSDNKCRASQRCVAEKSSSSVENKIDYDAAYSMCPPPALTVRRMLAGGLVTKADGLIS